MRKEKRYALLRGAFRLGIGAAARSGRKMIPSGDQIAGLKDACWRIFGMLMMVWGIFGGGALLAAGMALMLPGEFRTPVMNKWALAIFLLGGGVSLAWGIVELWLSMRVPSRVGTGCSRFMGLMIRPIRRAQDPWDGWALPWVGIGMFGSMMAGTLWGLGAGIKYGAKGIPGKAAELKRACEEAGMRDLAKAEAKMLDSVAGEEPRGRRAGL